MGLLAPRPAEACSCTMATPCEAYAQAATVFVGRPTSIVEKPGAAQEVTFAVTETLKGTVASPFVVQGGGMCGASFVMGRTYIVYVPAGTSRTVGLCSGTAPTQQAKAHLAYARGAQKRTRGIVEGVVVVEELSGRVPRAGAELRSGTQRVKTGKDGRYQLELAPGDHAITVVDAKAKLAAETRTDVTLATAAACEKLDLVLVWNGRVRGRVLGADGKPAAGVQVTLVGDKRANQFATTDARGAYEFSGVPAGEYKAVVFAANGVAKTTYYPSTDDSTQAKPIKLSQSAVVPKIDIQLR